MDENHPLYSAHLRFQRADIHLTECDRLVREFSDACIDHILTDDNGRIVRLDGWPEIPLMFPVVISDVIHNMRAALDYIIFELAWHDSGKIQNGTQFPIEDVKVDPVIRNRGFDARRKQYLKGLTADHIDMVEALQPYKGVDWTKTLRSISNPDKHRTLTVLSSFKRAVQLMPRPAKDGRFGPMRFQTADSSVMSRYDVELDAHDAIAIAPSEPGEKSIMGTLRELELEVARTIELFKPEFKI